MKNNTLHVFMIISLLLLLGNPITASPITLEEALELGWNNSREIQRLTHTISDLERAMEDIQGLTSWQLDMQGGALKRKDVREYQSPFDEEILREIRDETDNEDIIDLIDSLLERDMVITDIEQVQASISASRYFPFGLLIQPALSIQDQRPFDFSHLGERVQLSLTASMQLYPWIPPEPEQQYKALELNLLAAKANLSFQEAMVELTWLEGYLDLLRTQETLILARESYELAQKQLEQVLKEKEMGEAGEQRLLGARLETMEAETRLLQAETGLDLQKRSWLLSLGLPLHTSITLNPKDPLLETKRHSVEALNLQEACAEDLLTIVLEQHPQALISRLEQALLEDKIYWQEQGFRPQVQATGNYQRVHDDYNWSLGLTISYNLLDGGQKQRELDSLQKELDREIKDYERLKQDLSLQLEGFLHEVLLAQMTLENRALAVKRSQLEKGLIQTQYDMGLITHQELEAIELSLRQRELDKKRAEDRLLLSQLQVQYFLGLPSSVPR